MNNYVPMFQSLLDSSVWQESKEVRLLWVAMLVMKDSRHIVSATAFAMAKRAGLTEREVIDALKVLAAPDTSRLEPQEFEGRRIEKVDGGWLILNGEKYQAQMSEANRRARQAEWVRRKRAREAALKQGTQSPRESKPESAHASASAPDPEGGCKGETEIPTLEQAVAMVMTSGIPEDFTRFVYEDWSSRGGHDAANVPVTFLRYATKRWARESVEWRARTHKGNKPAGQITNRDGSKQISASDAWDQELARALKKAGV